MSDQLEIAALGRPFTLGMLYDSRKDQLITGPTLFDKDFLEKCRSKETQTSCTTNVLALDSFESKSSVLDVSASLKASFLGGLIEVGGSAGYLKNKKRFKNQSRITFSYKATSTFERLILSYGEMGNLPVTDVIERTGATHVVTGILYGANAFFVFDSEKLDSSSAQTIEASMKVAAGKIPALSIEAEARTKLSEEEKAATNKFTCTYHGDLNLDRNPTTFEDAVKTYSKLPELLKENTTAVRVWLTPLKNLDPSAAELKGEFSVGLLRKAENILEIIKEMEMRCNEALDEEVVENFPHIQKKLKSFQHLCEDYTTTIRSTMKKKIPLIRDGKEDETSMRKIFDHQEKSPFSEGNLDKWLDNIEREINIIRSYMDILKEVKMVPDESDVDREVLSGSEKDVFCFVFTSVETDDPYLDQMTDYLSCDFTQTPAKVTPPSKDHWFFSHNVFTTITQKAKDFVAAARRLKTSRKFSFLVTSLPNENYKGGTVYHYRDGQLKNEDFSKPVFDVTSVTDRRDLLWHFCSLMLDPFTVNHNLTLYDGNKKAVYGDQQKYPNDPERFDGSPQVLSTGALKELHYFEVDWSSGIPNSVCVGLAYKGIPRKGDINHCRFGYWNKSWGFENSHTNLIGIHEKRSWTYPFPPGGCSKVGVYLDWPAGSLSFYKVCPKTVTHLHTFKSQFTEPLYPGFVIQFKSNWAALRPLE